MRHYYDIYCLLGDQQVLEFVGTAEYLEHKDNWFRKDDIQVINENPAFSLSDQSARVIFDREYESKTDMYFEEQIPFDAILARIAEFADRL